MNRVEHLPLEDGYRLEQDYTARVSRLDDAVEARRAWLEKRMSAAPRVRWDTLLFSAKEAAYKAWFPLTGATPGFADVEMTEPTDGRFTLRLLTQGRGQTRPGLPRLEGGWLASRGLIITAVAAPA